MGPAERQGLGLWAHLPLTPDTRSPCPTGPGKENGASPDTPLGCASLPELTKPPPPPLEMGGPVRVPTEGAGGCA